MLVIFCICLICFATKWPVIKMRLLTNKKRRTRRYRKSKSWLVNTMLPSLFAKTMQLFYSHFKYFAWWWWSGINLTNICFSNPDHFKNKSKMIHTADRIEASMKIRSSKCVRNDVPTSVQLCFIDVDMFLASVQRNGYTNQIIYQNDLNIPHFTLSRY